MKAKKPVDTTKTNIHNMHLGLLSNARESKLAFVLLILIYLAGYYYVLLTSRSEGVLMLFGHPVPLRSMTGAFSSLMNLCIILIVVFYGKPGFVVSMIVLIWQFPSILMGIFLGRNYTSIPGFFMNILTIITVLLLRNNNIKIEKYQQRLREQAFIDALTGLPNRFACSETMDALSARGEKFVVATLNLNNFKNINNTMGHETGNAVLIEIASRLKNASDKGLSGTVDTITCQGGDEFSLIIRHYDSDDAVLKTLQFYNSLIKEKITVDGCDYFLTASIGYAEYPTDGASSSAVLSCANTAMTEAKYDDSGSHICRYSHDLPNAQRALEIERKIRTALETDSLFFVLQPQYDISHKLSGFEALARLRDADGSLINPQEFVPVAEKIGLIDKVDHVVLTQSAKFFGKLVRETHTDSTLSVNVSVKHLMKNDFLDEVREILSSSGIPAHQFEIEITESVLIDSVDKALQCINEIKKMGVKIAIDDFGTGYSSLSYLSSFPADTLKVDKSFIDQMNTSDSSKQYVAAIISIGHVMNFSVISEGVELPEQLETLRSIGCDFIQGFLWGRPMSPEDAEELVKSSMQRA